MGRGLDILNMVGLEADKRQRQPQPRKFLPDGSPNPEHPDNQAANSIGGKINYPKGAS